jgi:hypothetical protein
MRRQRARYQRTDRVSDRQTTVGSEQSSGPPVIGTDQDQNRQITDAVA